MATVDEQILEQNPWWRDPSAVEGDPYLSRLRASPLRWRPPVLETIEVQPQRLHTLRGPRQVGKSTSCKLLVESLLTSGERRVLYFAFDLARDGDTIVDVVRRARQLHPDPDGPWYVFLDEVTLVPEWQRAVKYAVDTGLLAQDFVLCTGSSARLLGTEQLTGRRGSGHDFLQLPLSFRDFCESVLGYAMPGAAARPDALLEPDGRRLIRSLYLHVDDLRRGLALYQSVGGFPAAAVDYLSSGAVAGETLQMLWSMVAGDVQAAGRDSVAVLKLLERVGRSLGSSLSWKSLAEDIGVGSLATARECVALLAESFVLLVVYFWDPSTGSLNPRRQRKVYYVDPLFDAVTSLIVPGARRAPESGVGENLVAIALYRSATDRLVQAAPVPGSVGVWRSGRGTEIDFLIPVGAHRGGTDRLAIEVKGDAPNRISNARKSIGRAFGRGLVATATRFEPDHEIPAIPVAVLLAALAERPRRSVMAL